VSEGGLAGLVEQSPLHAPGADDLRGWWFLAIVQVGVAICVPLFALGGQLGQHMRFLDLVPALLAGTTLTALTCMLTGVVGVHARVPTALVVQRAFGPGGGRLVAAIFIVTLFGWFGVQTELLVKSIDALLASATGVHLPRFGLTIACGLIMSSTAIIGVKALGKVAYLAVPLLLAIIAVPTWLTLSTRDVHALVSAPAASAPFPFGVAVSIVYGGYMVGIAVAPDLTRFLRTTRDVVIGCGVSLGIVLPLLIGVSALLAVAYGTGDLIALLVATSVGIPALLVLVLATWTSNDKNLYEAALGLSSLLPGVERWKLTAVAGAIGTLVAAAGIFQHFITMLIGLGITIGPIAGVYFADFLVRRDAYEGDAPAGGPSVRWSAMAAWALGILAGLATLPPDEFGFGLLRLTGVSALDAFLAAMAGYVALSRVATRGAARVGA
jgi:cytosine permease